MIQIFQIIDSKSRKLKETTITMTRWPYTSIIFVTINYLGFKSMAFSMEFNAFDVHFDRFNGSVREAVRCSRSKKKWNWNTLNPYKLPGSSSCSRRSATAACPCPFDGIHAERKQQKLHLHFFTQPKIKCRLFFLWSTVATAPHNTFVRSFPVGAGANCEFGICVGRKLAAHRHYVAYALIIFTFILRSLDSVKKEEKEEKKTNNKWLNFRWDH